MTSSAQKERALEARVALSDARSASRRDGRPSDWFVARPSSQRWAGLHNEGATCYLNSLLQSLFVSHDVRRAVFSFEYDEAVHGPPASCVPLQLCKLFTRMQHSRQHAVSARPLIASFGWSQADAFQQHDVQELCRVLFDALERSGGGGSGGGGGGGGGGGVCGGVCGAGSLGRLFQGQLRSTLRCPHCGHESARTEAFSDVQLDIAAASTLAAALEHFVAEEVLDGDNAWQCDGCGRRVAARKSVRFDALPPLLMIQLKRFTYDAAEMRLRKLHHRVEFPLSLSMARYRTPPSPSAAAAAAAAAQAVAAAATEGGGAAAVEAAAEEDAEAGDEYECYGVLVHSGSTTGGHYTALLREETAPPPPPPSQEPSAPPPPPPEVVGSGATAPVVADSAGAAAGWFEFNDHHVQPAPPTALQAAFGACDSGCSCYLLLYRRVCRGAQGGVAAEASAGAPEPPSGVLAEVLAEEAEAERLRACKRAAEVGPTPCPLPFRSAPSSAAATICAHPSPSSLPSRRSSSSSGSSPRTMCDPRPPCSCT